MEFGNYLENLSQRKPEKGIHSYLHKVVKEVCEYLNVPKEFGRWLGIGKKIGAGELKSKLEYIKERGIKSPNYLSACCKMKKLTN